MPKSSLGVARAALHRFFGDTSGASSIEYAIIASGVSIVIAAAVMALGTSVRGFYTSVAAALK